MHHEVFQHLAEKMAPYLACIYAINGNVPDVTMCVDLMRPWKRGTHGKNMDWHPACPRFGENKRFR